MANVNWSVPTYGDFVLRDGSGRERDRCDSLAALESRAIYMMAKGIIKVARIVELATGEVWRTMRCGARESNPMAKHTVPVKRGPRKYWIGDEPTHCQLCKAPIRHSFVDGRIEGRTSWAILCRMCHLQYGAGTGEGLGQVYRNGRLGWVKVGQDGKDA